MDNNLLHHYERELQFLREAGREFSLDYPKIADRLGIGDEGAPDPSVERLLEGVAFLTARIQQQLDAAFPHFSENLLALTQPEALMPTPSFAVAQLTPDRGEGALAGGYTVPAGETLREARMMDLDATDCEFRTLTPVTLWPVEIVAATYTAVPVCAHGDVSNEGGNSRAQIRLQLRTSGGQLFSALEMDDLTLYLRDSIGATALYEAMTAHVCGVAMNGEGGDCFIVGARIHPGGMLDDVMLDDQMTRYALIKHFFAFPEGYRFVRIAGLRAALKDHNTGSLEVVMALSTPMPALSRVLTSDSFALFCTPVINLFPKRCDRLVVEHHAHEYPLIVDRSRQRDYQIHQVSSVQGYAANGRALGELRPWYGPLTSLQDGEPGGYLLRRATSARRRDSDAESTLFISLCGDAIRETKQLGVAAWCSNGALPLRMMLGKGSTDLVPDSHIPVRAIRLLSGPSRPLPAPAQGEKALRAINQLARGYLALATNNGEAGAGALRELLALFLPADHRAGKRWLEGILSLRSEVVTRQMPGPGPIVFARGTLFQLELDEQAYEGVGVLLFGAMLDAFLVRYAALNSFTTLRLVSRQRGVLQQWAARSGQCLVI